MSHRFFRNCLAAAALLAAFGASASAQTVSFTYQGQLSEAGQLADGLYDFQFTFYNQLSNGVPISSTHCADNVAVVDGLFTVDLPLVVPANVAGAFLNISVRDGALGNCSSGAGYQALTPRQPLKPTPQATYASAIGNTAPSITGAMRYNPSASRVEFFDGTYWHALATVNNANIIEPPNGAGYGFAGTYPFVVPAGVTSLIVQIHGGGGGGGSVGPGTTSLPGFCSAGVSGYAAGGGGGSAGRGAAYVLDVTPGETLTIIVGQGGNGGNGGNGTAGQPTRIRRAGIDIVSVPGGNPGSRALSSVNMASDPSPNACEGFLGGAGASVPADPTFTGPGRLIELYVSGPGGYGEGPACTGSLNPSFCPANGGPGGNPAPGLFASGAGAGGDGGGGIFLAENGSPGKVFLFWY